MEQIDKIIERITNEFSAKPIASTIKGLIVLWVLKEVREWWNK